jgi:hypothetical protein
MIGRGAARPTAQYSVVCLMGYAPDEGTITRHSGGIRERMKIPTATTMMVETTHPNKPPRLLGMARAPVIDMDVKKAAVVCR